MKIARTFLVSALLVILSSCDPILSLHPWYTESDLVLEPVLAGDWYAVDDNGAVDRSNTWIFAQDVRGGYTLSVMDNAHPGIKQTFAIYLFRLNGQLFLDASQGSTYFKDDETDDGGFRITGHMAGTISIDADSVHMSFLDDDWVKDSLKSNPSLVRNERVDGNVYLTAGGTELRQFLLSAIGKEKAFNVNVDLKRKSAAAQATVPKP